MTQQTLVNIIDAGFAARSCKSVPHEFMATPRVSLVIPAYNAESYIDEALQSALEQNFAGLEIIVVDDGSTDGTAQRAASYAPAVTCVRRANSGGFPGVTRNTGIERAAGRYLCFLDADDVMLPGRLEAQVQFLEAHPEVGLVFTDYRNFTPAGPMPQTHFQRCARIRERLGTQPALVLAQEQATMHLLLENFGTPSSTMLRREVLSEVPGFPTDLQTSEDFHFFYNVARRFGVGILKSVGALRRLHDSNITGDSLKVLRNYLTSRTQLRDTETSPLNRQLLEDFLFDIRIDLARAYAHQRSYSKAVEHNLHALAAVTPRSLGRLRPAVKTLIRTAAIASHLKRPCP